MKWFRFPALLEHISPLGWAHILLTGESGLFGREEAEIIASAIEAARAGGIDASGPWSGDTVSCRPGKIALM
ncbi:4-hydroxythreonine-4-phosphate dehydrogenase PdxA [Roseovarius sp. MMSF_3281]|uniref:4-hydroxythreonine-4-phosphate dehydrogenase PdxA n=1 Tax=Roseovarius sp. MMSF_3281 TaxID=3046694 RepID=UPI00273E7FC7|nr:4-hydroxythreonine-4-phosphate dehydrogenase PdxA [Roseovarius sp. MMSF_3281]